ncbi:MAG: DUF2059 domain-containing protein [Proteobacteria bacterium]|nr:DUF2059 domain-containing protein [Pseudomonadota bacterium]
MKHFFSSLSIKSLSLYSLLFIVGLQASAYATSAKQEPQPKEQVKAAPSAKDNEFGEDPGPIYTQVVLQWAKTTHFAENAAKVIVGKFELEMENDPKMKQVMTKDMLADLEQFFYELFLSGETIRALAALYAQYFTIDDMQDLLKFYQSSVGQKLIKADPELKVKTQKIGEMLLKKHEKEYMAVVGKYLVKNQNTTPQKQ